MEKPIISLVNKIAFAPFMQESTIPKIVTNIPNKAINHDERGIALIAPIALCVGLSIRSNIREPTLLSDVISNLRALLVVEYTKKFAGKLDESYAKLSRQLKARREEHNGFPRDGPPQILTDRNEFLHCVSDASQSRSLEFHRSRNSEMKTGCDSFSSSSYETSCPPAEVVSTRPARAVGNICELNVIKNRILLLERSVSALSPTAPAVEDSRVAALLTRVEALEQENRELRESVSQTDLLLESRLISMEAMITKRNDATISKLALIVQQLLDRQRVVPKRTNNDKEVALSELSREIAYIKGSIK